MVSSDPPAPILTPTFPVPGVSVTERLLESICMDEKAETVRGCRWADTCVTSCWVGQGQAGTEWLLLFSACT